MANYGLAANTVFKNRSFEDLLKPLAMYTEEYNAQENALNELETKANVWENMANEETDPIAYAQYKRYADNLRNQAVSLANNGLTPSTRRDILNLRRRYASEIAPIEQAFANRKQQADEQRKALLQNPTLLLSRRADMTSLDDYLANPELGYDQYSGALLTNQVGTAAQALAKELRDYGNGKPLDGFTKTWIQQHGFTKEEVARAINDPYSPRSSEILNTLVEGVMADSGIPQWADRSTLAQAYAYARQGLWQAVGQTTVTPYENFEARQNKELEIAKEKARIAAGLDENGYKSVQLQGNPFNLDTHYKMSDKRLEHNEYAKYFDADGNMTQEGWDMYNYIDFLKKKPSGLSVAVPFLPGVTKFKEYMDSLNGGKEISGIRPFWTNGKITPEIAKKFGDLYRERSKELDGSTEDLNADTFRNTAFDIQFKDPGAVKTALTSGKNNGVHSSYKYGQKGYVVGESVNLLDKKYKLEDAAVAGEIGLQGNFVVVTRPDGKQDRIPLGAIHPNLDKAVTKQLNGAAGLYYKSDGTPYTSEELNAPLLMNGRVTTIQDIINGQINAAQENFMAAFEQMNTEPHKVAGGLHLP